MGQAIKELGRRIRTETEDPRSLQFLIQGIAVAVQWGNIAVVRGIFPHQTMFFIDYSQSFSSAVV